MNTAPLKLFQSFRTFSLFVCKPYHHILCNRTIAKTLCQCVFRLKKKRFVDIFLCSHFCHIPHFYRVLYMFVRNYCQGFMSWVYMGCVRDIGVCVGVCRRMGWMRWFVEWSDRCGGSYAECSQTGRLDCVYSPSYCAGCSHKCVAPALLCVSLSLNCASSTELRHFTQYMRRSQALFYLL